jgi:hypothetical protein
MAIKKRSCLLVLLCALAFQCFAGCGGQKMRIGDEQARSLQKLCRVWGFAVSTHRSFLLGLKDWDEELLGLIPAVLSAGEGEVNGMLHEWFVGLGEDGYDLDWKTYRPALLAHYEETKGIFHNLLAELGSDGENSYEEIVRLRLQSLLQEIDDAADFVLGYGEVSSWEAMDVFAEELFRVSGAEMNSRPMADTNWVNESYLGGPLCAALSRFRRNQIVDLAKAPVCFDVFVGKSTFANQDDLPDMDFSDGKYRLLGLLLCGAVTSRTSH